jgi:hypothetical protein
MNFANAVPNVNFKGAKMSNLSGVERPVKLAFKFVWPLIVVATQNHPLSVVDRHVGYSSGLYGLS